MEPLDMADLERRSKEQSERIRKALLKGVERQVKQAQRASRDGVKHADGSTRPDRAARAKASHRRSKQSKQSRRRNR